MGGDGIRQSLQFYFVKVLPGLPGIGFYPVERQQLIRAFFLGALFKITQQSAEAFA